MVILEPLIGGIVAQAPRVLGLSRRHQVVVRDHADVGQRPVDQHRFADDVAQVQGSPVLRVRGVVAVVAQHEQGAGLDPPAAVVAWGGGDVGFLERGTVDVYVPAAHLDPVPRQADDALDEAARGVEREAEDDDVAADGFRPPVGQPVDDHHLAIVQAGLHAGAFHPDAGGHQIHGQEEQGGDKRRLQDLRQHGPNRRATRLGGGKLHVRL